LGHIVANIIEDYDIKKDHGQIQANLKQENVTDLKWAIFRRIAALKKELNVPSTEGDT
jgi:hypothetical protein